MNDLKHIALIVLFVAIIGALTWWRLDPGPAEPLHEATYTGNVQRVRDLIAAGMNINARSLRGKILDQRPLIKRLLQRPEEVVETKAGSGTTWISFRGCTPLLMSVYWGKSDIAKALLDGGADTEIKDPNGTTPLFLAVGMGRKEIVHLLIAAGARVNVANGDGETLLHKVRVGKDAEDIINMLIRAGANVNARNAEGETPLHRCGSIAVRILLAAGADIKLRNRWGQTPLHLAARESGDIANALIVAGADVNAQDVEGDTPLHEAYRFGHEDAADILLKAGADPNIKNKEGKTALYIKFYPAPPPPVPPR